MSRLRILKTLSRLKKMLPELMFTDTSEYFNVKTITNRNLQFRLRIDYSITKRAHSPTPGVYMGTKGGRERGGRGGGDRDYGRSRYHRRYFILH